MNSKFGYFYRLVLLLLGLSFGKSTQGQQPYFIEYNEGNGLASNLTYDILQDRQGYIWIATDVGVNRFDGKQFTHYTTDDGLTDNEVFSIFEDSKGRLWFGTYNGQPCFWENGQFYNATNFPPLRTLHNHSFIRSIIEDEEGNIIISNIKDGFTIISPDFDVHEVRRDGDAQIEFTWPSPNSQGIYFVGPIMVNYLDLNNEIVHFIDSVPVTTNIARGYIKDSLLFLGLSEYLFLYHTTTGKLSKQIPVSFNQAEIIQVYHGPEALWVGTRNGVFRLRFKNDQYQEFEREHYLKGKSVSNILCDREGNIWFCTLESGVFFSPSPKALHYTTEEGLPDSKIYCLSKDFQDRLWMGFTKNRYAILEKDTLHNYRTTNLYRGEVNAIRHFDEEETFITGKGIGLHIDKGKEAVYIRSSSDIIKDRFGKYWTSLWTILRMDRQRLNELMRPPNSQFDRDQELLEAKQIILEHTVSPLRVACFEDAGTDTMWAGTNQGLHWLHYNKDSVISHSLQPVLPYRISDLLFDKERKLLWVASPSNGLFALRNQKIIHHFTTADGLSDNICTEVCLGKYGEIWVGTTKGLNRILLDRSEPQIHKFSDAFGLNEIKIDAIEVIGEKIYLATEKGLTVLPTYSPITPKQPPLIYLDKFEVDGQVISLDSTPCLNYTDNAVSFYFTGLNFRDQGQTRFKYRLLGQDDQWLSTNSGLIHFRSLAPGEYCFEVKAINRLNQESLGTARHFFSIAPPIWEKPGFRLGAILFIFAIAYLFWHRRLKRERLKFQLEQKLIEAENEKLELEKNYLDLELRALRLQMNPHFLFNALNTIKGYYAEDRTREANTYISKFAKLLRLILEQPDKYMPLEKEIRLLRFYMDLSKIRYPGKFDYHIEVAPEIQPENTAIPPMLLQPFIENAIIHGLIPRPNGHGQIRIKFHLQNGHLVSTVSDNGIGRTASAKINRPANHQSKAIEITRERLEIIHSSKSKKNYLKIVDLYTADQPSGTQVILNTPYKKLW